jgi:hypothetical protein
MKARGKKIFYPSECVLGKYHQLLFLNVYNCLILGNLYRSARRAEIGWSRAITNHIHSALTLTAGIDVKDQENDITYYNQSLDPFIYHPDYAKYLPEIKSLYKLYQNELLEFISLYRFQDEIDLFCRCESMDASAGSSEKDGLEASAYIEVKNLVDRITEDFCHEFRRRRIDCDTCAEDKLTKAACAYIYIYEESNRLPLKSNRRILSFPWLFSE